MNEYERDAALDAFEDELLDTPIGAVIARLDAEDARSGWKTKIRRMRIREARKFLKYGVKKAAEVLIDVPEA